MPAAATNIRRLIAVRNREVLLPALIEGVLGILFTFIVFLFLFAIMWGLGGIFAAKLGLTRTQFALAVVGLFALVTFFSAWRRVDPLQEVAPMSDTQLMLTYISLASPYVLYFSPKHVSAGLAVVLIGGPENILSAIGKLRDRLPSDDRLIADAANMLILAEQGIAVEDVPSPQAAVLLRRLALIKAVDHGDAVEIVLTEKGREAAGIA